MSLIQSTSAPSPEDLQHPRGGSPQFEDLWSRGIVERTRVEHLVRTLKHYLFKELNLVTSTAVERRAVVVFCRHQSSGV
jgi:hypothetical protein